MDLGKINAILGYCFILITSYRMVTATAVYQLSDIHENGDDFAREVKDISIILKSDDSSDVGNLNHYLYKVPVHHFSRHSLCRHEMGRQHFYRAIKSKLCQIKETFIASIVEQLCSHRGWHLDKWVSELFDIDGDGMITHFEKRIYEFDY